MQTSFTLAQLADPDTAEADRILRACVHCGFCTATCPTYVLLGDELDSPRGRIYLIKDMLENDRPATAEVVKHIDRCLSCLACMTTCPSGVHYMHLVDHARDHIERTYTRPLGDRLLRAILARVLPHNSRFRRALSAARLGKPFARLFAGLGFNPVAAMLRLAPDRLPVNTTGRGRRRFSPAGPRRGRIALLDGCVGPVLAPSINAAAIRLLTRHGIEVIVAEDGCCGALVHHLGREQEALDAARRRIDAWTAELEGEGLDAILVTASGCGTMVKDYGHLLRTDSAYADKAARVSRLTMDISEYLSRLKLPTTRPLPNPFTYDEMEAFLSFIQTGRLPTDYDATRPREQEDGNRHRPHEPQEEPRADEERGGNAAGPGGGGDDDAPVFEVCIDGGGGRASDNAGGAAE